jgi:hypothetical protein
MRRRRPRRNELSRCQRRLRGRHPRVRRGLPLVRRLGLRPVPRDSPYRAQRDQLGRGARRRVGPVRATSSSCSTPATSLPTSPATSCPTTWPFPADKTYVFPAGFVLAPGEWRVLIETDLLFGIAQNKEETVLLVDARGEVIDSVTFDGAIARASWCRVPDGNGAWAACDQTFGTANLAASGSCGDDEVNGIEECDGADLGGQTCEVFGFVGGALACTGRLPARHHRLRVQQRGRHQRARVGPGRHRAVQRWRHSDRRRRLDPHRRSRRPRLRPCDRPREGRVRGTDDDRLRGVLRGHEGHGPRPAPIRSQRRRRHRDPCFGPTSASPTACPTPRARPTCPTAACPMDPTVTGRRGAHRPQGAPNQGG